MTFTVYVTSEGLVSLLKGELVDAKLKAVDNGRIYDTPVVVDGAWFVQSYHPYGRVEGIKIRKPSWFRRIFS